MAERVLNISVRAAGSATIVDLEGGIDIRNSTVLRSRLLETISATPRLALNMTGIDYVDSSGIATLVEVLKKSRDLNKHFALFGLQPRVFEVLKLTQLLPYFQIFDTEVQALEGTADAEH